MNNLTEKTSISSLTPDSWFSEDMPHYAWLTAYRMMLTEQPLLPKPIIHDYKNLRVILFFGKLAYLDNNNIKYNWSNNGTLTTTANNQITLSEESGWLIILQPYNNNIDCLNENNLRYNAGVYAGLYSALNTQNIAFIKLCDNVINLENNNITTFGPAIKNCLTFPPLDLSSAKSDLMQNAGTVIAKLPDAEKNRIMLSLHWFEKGLRSIGIDGFISMWIALETLGMPNTTDVRPIIQKIANAYHIPYDKAQQKFQIGKIHGLRGRILHEGENIVIHANLSDYIEAIYSDVLFETIGLSSEKRSEKILTRNDFNLTDLLNIQSRKKPTPAQ